MPKNLDPVKKYAKGSPTKWHWEHDYTPKQNPEFYSNIVNKEKGAKIKTRVKCIKELQRRGINLVWVERKDPRRRTTRNK